ncbi:MAG: hypothetical protein JXA37_14350 [Chloroflexia bacterium]|nr:hypothetical protein [Chloroflexia bacterium]
MDEQSLPGLTAEAYRAVVALIDDRMREIRVTREDFDRLTSRVAALAEAQWRTEERVNALVEAQQHILERLERLEATVQALAEAQLRTEERLERLEATVQNLVEAQQYILERLERLEATVQALAEAQLRTEECVNVLVETQQHLLERLDRLEATVQALAEAQLRTEERVNDIQIDLAGIKGRVLEMDYRDKAPSYFGLLLRRLRLLPLVEIEDEIEAHLSAGEVGEIFRLDFLLSGRPRQVQDAPEVWLAVEVSSVVDRHDVERALRRARLLQRLGRPVVPVVAGLEATLGAAQQAEASGLLLLQDGRTLYWEEALAAALSA